ncbi:hypothetical protein KP509_33G067500 [Ceratopteris richardii]|uniref:Uncharacterized protein n=1 Tax=Ceratopteris richardii TaxID=49495 RepID=A0A8T2QRR8_CERRI|nr:hypothetical protein KP509_33G067500 [Ceratopteris richardii]
MHRREEWRRCGFFVCLRFVFLLSCSISLTCSLCRIRYDVAWRTENPSVVQRTRMFFPSLSHTLMKIFFIAFCHAQIGQWDCGRKDELFLLLQRIISCTSLSSLSEDGTTLVASPFVMVTESN